MHQRLSFAWQAAWDLLGQGRLLDHFHWYRHLSKILGHALEHSENSIFGPFYYLPNSFILINGPCCSGIEPFYRSVAPFCLIGESICSIIGPFCSDAGPQRFKAEPLKWAGVLPWCLRALRKWVTNGWLWRIQPCIHESFTLSNDINATVSKELVHPYLITPLSGILHPKNQWDWVIGGLQLSSHSLKLIYKQSDLLEDRSLFSKILRIQGTHLWQ